MRSTLRPAESGAVAAAWDDLGRRFQESVTAFHDATRAAVDTGWRGPTAAAVASALDDYAARAGQVGGRFTDVGDALRHATAGAEAVRGAVGRPGDHPADWTQVLPADWTADAAEQHAKAAMDTLYTSAYRLADEQLPAAGLAATHAAATAHGQPVGFDIGPNGVHGIPSDQQVAEPESDSVPRNEHRRSGEVPLEDRRRPRRPHRVRSRVRRWPAPSAAGWRSTRAASCPLTGRPPPSGPAAGPARRTGGRGGTTHLPRKHRRGKRLVGKLPLVTPAVIGE